MQAKPYTYDTTAQMDERMLPNALYITDYPNKRSGTIASYGSLVLGSFMDVKLPIWSWAFAY